MNILGLAAMAFPSLVGTPEQGAAVGMAVLVLCPIAPVTMTVAAVAARVLCGLRR